MKNMKKKHIFVVALSLLLFVGAYSYQVTKPTEVDALLPFGGFVNYVQYCTCSMAIASVVGPPVGGTFVYAPGTVTYAYGQVYRSGVWLLGNWTPGGVCLFYAGVGCGTFPVWGRMSEVATSL